jgi:hypothetical protein
MSTHMTQVYQHYPPSLVTGTNIGKVQISPRKPLAALLLFSTILNEYSLHNDPTANNLNTVTNSRHCRTVVVFSAPLGSTPPAQFLQTR